MIYAYSPAPQTVVPQMAPNWFTQAATINVIVNTCTLFLVQTRFSFISAAERKSAQTVIDVLQCPIPSPYKTGFLSQSDISFGPISPPQTFKSNLN